MNLSRRKGITWLIAALCVAIGALMIRPGAAQTPPAPETEPESATVKITFQTVPPVKAEVWWGKKKLGLIIDRRRPLIIERARDSGPLDVTVKAEGFLPVHTRAHTFNDHRVSVKLTAAHEKHTLFGYRTPLPDGGALPDAAP